MQYKMIIDALAGCSIKNKMHEEVKELIEQMCQNEYNTSNDRGFKKAEMLEIDKETAYKVEIELLKRKLAEKESTNTRFATFVKKTIQMVTVFQNEAPKKQSI
jgi:NAD(P)H-hydrate repair Nnr-like enzyme with NAD(P)H-hydrate epimerase domain